MDSLLQALSNLTIELPPVVEHRLYYDDRGAPLFYTCEKPQGNYVVVDSQTYAQGRYDCKVVAGVIKYPSVVVYSKLIPSTKGTACYSKDVSIISPTKTDAQHWKLKTYEKD